ncbi:hypothetical protein Q5752_002757 [Cryptotrichosporon argae]
MKPSASTHTYIYVLASALAPPTLASIEAALLALAPTALRTVVEEHDRDGAVSARTTVEVDLVLGPDEVTPAGRRMGAAVAEISGVPVKWENGGLALARRAKMWSSSGKTRTSSRSVASCETGGVV